MHQFICGSTHTATHIFSPIPKPQHLIILINYVIVSIEVNGDKDVIFQAKYTYTTTIR